VNTRWTTEVRFPWWVNEFTLRYNVCRPHKWVPMLKPVVGNLFRTIAQIRHAELFVYSPKQFGVVLFIVGYLSMLSVRLLCSFGSSVTEIIQTKFGGITKESAHLLRSNFFFIKKPHRTEID
jgi:hypothetical protein